MKSRILLCLFTLALAPASRPQDKLKITLPPECTKTIRARTPFPRGPFKFRENEKYRGAPTISYQIQEDGLVTDVSLKRSSGIADIDRKYLASVAGWKFKPRPAGCGVIDSEVTMLIHWDAH